MRKHNMILYGRKATEEMIIKEISRMLLGDPVRRLEPLSVTDTAKALGYTRKTIYLYIKKAVEKYHLLEYNDKGRLILPDNPKLEFKRFNKNHNEIIQDPLVSEWKQDLMTRKNGEPITTWKKRILSLESVCNTCKVNPKELIISQKQTEKILKNYAELYREGLVDGRSVRRNNMPHDIRYVVYQKV